MRRDVLQQLLQARRDGRPLVRALDVESGAERLIDPSQDRSALAEAAAEAARGDRSGAIRIEGRTWLLTAYGAPWEIVIVGAVHIAQALAALGAAAGYRVRVIDPRAAYAAPERFAGMSLERQWPEDALAARPLTRHSALIALAHDPRMDDEALEAALASPAFYIGALGSARTHARRLERLRARGLPQDALAAIRGPVGLAIGARAPAEIAVAILAELVQRRRSQPRIAGIVLAAGRSSRMGRNKMTMLLDAKPLVRHAVEAALASRLDPVIVVTGHEAGAVQQALAGAAVRFAHNDRYGEGLSTSLRAGIGAVPADCDGAMVLLGDMPAITPALIGRMLDAFDPGAVCVATSGGRRGHPVLWGRKFFGDIQALTGDTGARSLMAAAQVREVEAGSDAPLADLDTPQAFAAYGAGPAQAARRTHTGTDL